MKLQREMGRTLVTTGIWCLRPEGAAAERRILLDKDFCRLIGRNMRPENTSGISTTIKKNRNITQM
jgi:hypothetical protein